MAVPAGSAGPSRLTPIPPSPSSSHSSLTSEETSFDHRAPFTGSPLTSPVSTSSTPTTARPGRLGDHSNAQAQTLGLRELVKMRKAEKARERARALPLSHGAGQSLVAPEIRGEVQILHSPVSELDEGDAMSPSPIDGPFASQVVIRGWKVVGGKSWTDGGKVGAYVVYDIDISLRHGGTINILRRYTDFVRLRTTLKSHFPKLGQAIPPLPGKGHMSKFNPKFLEERQPRLQRFLRGVILHPEMGKGGERSVVGQWVTGPGG